MWRVIKCDKIQKTPEKENESERVFPTEKIVSCYGDCVYRAPRETR